MNGNMNLGKRVTVLEKGGGADIKKEISVLKEEVAATQYAVRTAQNEIDALETKVNSGIVYSTEERAVGTWIDSSTIYQKTYMLSKAITANANDWTKIEDLNEKSAVDGLLYVDANKNPFRLCGFKFDNGLYVFAPLVLSISGFTIQYTKTTDTPTS